MSPERYPYSAGTWHDRRDLTDTPDRGEWRCPYCDSAMPDAIQPELWECCGEMGHAEHWHVDKKGKWVKTREEK